MIETKKRGRKGNGKGKGKKRGRKEEALKKEKLLICKQNFLKNILCL